MLVALAFTQQLVSLCIDVQQQHYPQAVLSGMVLVSLLGLGVFIATRQRTPLRFSPEVPAPRDSVVLGGILSAVQ